MSAFSSIKFYIYLTYDSYSYILLESPLEILRMKDFQFYREVEFMPSINSYNLKQMCNSQIFIGSTMLTTIGISLE